MFQPRTFGLLDFGLKMAKITHKNHCDFKKFVLVICHLLTTVNFSIFHFDKIQVTIDKYINLTNRFITSMFESPIG